MKILIVSPLYEIYHWGGLAHSCRRIALALKSQGHDVIMVNIDAENQYWDEKNKPTGFFKTEDEGLELYHVPQNYSYTGVELPKQDDLAVKLNQWYLFLKDLAKEVKPDIAISFFIAPYGYPLALISQEFGFSLISAIRGNDIGRFMHDPIVMPLLKHILENSKITVCLAKDLETQVKLLYPKAKTKVLYNSVDPKVYERQWNDIATKKELVIGSVGIFKPKKGMEFFFKAFNSKKWKNLSLLLVGDFHKSTTKKEDLIKSSINKIRITGVVTRPEVMKYLDQIDIFVTLTNSDGCPNAILEAMAAGKCIITTPVAAMPDLLKHKHSAYFVDKLDQDLIVRAIEELLLNRELIKKIGKNARLAAKKLLPPYEIDGWNKIIKTIK